MPARPVAGDHKYISYFDGYGPYLIVSSCSLHFQIIQHLKYASAYIIQSIHPGTGKTKTSQMTRGHEIAI